MFVMFLPVRFPAPHLARVSSRVLLVMDRYAVTATATRTLRRRAKPRGPPAYPQLLWWIAHPDSRLVAVQRLHVPPVVRQPPERPRRRGIWKRKSGSAETLCSVGGISRAPLSVTRGEERGRAGWNTLPTGSAYVVFRMFPRQIGRR